VEVGKIILNPRHYIDSLTGKLKPKYFLILAFANSGDLIVRLPTSRQHSRPENPACSHADPYPSFYPGVPGGELKKKTWLDLRSHPDLDASDAGRRVKSGAFRPVLQLDRDVFIPAMECAARAPDTTRYQEIAISDAISRMRQRMPTAPSGRG